MSILNGKQIMQEVQSEALSLDYQAVEQFARHVADYASARNLSTTEKVIGLCAALEGIAAKDLKGAFLVVENMKLAMEISKLAGQKQVIATVGKFITDQVESAAFASLGGNVHANTTTEPLTSETLDKMKRVLTGNNYATGGFVPGRRNTDLPPRVNPRPVTRQGRPFGGDVA